MPQQPAPPRSSSKAPVKSGGPSPRHRKNNTTAPSLRELYTTSCDTATVRPNSTIVSLLPDKQGVALSGEVLDLSRNYLGDKGIGPLLNVVQRSTHLKSLVLTENGLRNNAVRMICAVLAQHPGITSLDLSDNYISEGAGVALIRLIDQNPRLVEIKIDNTKISVEHRVCLKDRIAQNVKDYAITT
eukprot:Tbor_TRINITY_DN5463_c1_g5::TRINITY_DN5463_c1_g5_i1::g.25059::m.25059